MFKRATTTASTPAPGFLRFLSQKISAQGLNVIVITGLSTLCLLLQMLTTVSIAWWVSYDQQAKVRRATLSRINVFSGVISDQLSIGDYRSVESIANALAHGTNILYVRVVTDGNFEIAKAGDLSQVPERLKPLRTALDLGSASQELDYMETYIRPSQFSWADLQRLWPMFLITLGAVTLLSLWVYILIRRTVIYPLQQLQHAAERLELGQSSHRIQGAREISALSNSLNTMARHIKEQSIRDALTHLHNRSYLEEHLEQYIAQYRPMNLSDSRLSGTSLTLLFIDLDHFKHINDTFGHMFGDDVLVSLAQLLRDNSQSDWEICRFGGDEFVIALHNYAPSSVAHVANQLLRASKRPLMIENHRLNFTFSIGASRFPDDCHSVQGLLRTADIALYEAKRRGRNNAVLYQTHLQKSAENWMTVSKLLNDALERRLVRHAIQPIVNAQTHRVHAVEMLLRLNNPDGGYISPELIFEVADSFRLANEMTRLTFRNLASNERDLKENHSVQRPKFFLNLTRSQVLQLDFAPQDTLHNTPSIERDIAACNHFIRTLIQQNKAHQVVVEITEGEYLEDQRLIAQLERLTASGFALALDDFGSGYASLTCLSQLPLSYVKLDKTLTKRIPEDKKACHLLQGIVETANRLNLKVIAEGVESEAQCHFLQQSGCHYMQGFLFSKPIFLQETSVDHGWQWEACALAPDTSTAHVS